MGTEPGGDLIFVLLDGDDDGDAGDDDDYNFIRAMYNTCASEKVSEKVPVFSDGLHWPEKAREYMKITDCIASTDENDNESVARGKGTLRTEQLH